MAAAVVRSEREQYPIHSRYVEIGDSVAVSSAWDGKLVKTTSGVTMAVVSGLPDMEFHLLCKHQVTVIIAGGVVSYGDGVFAAGQALHVMAVDGVWWFHGNIVPS